MTEFMKFNFKSPISEDDVKKLESLNGKKEPKLLQPGKYDLKITEATIKGPMSGDASWFNVSVTLGGIDSRSIRMFVGVPTSSPLYNKPGIKNEHKLLMFHKFREFMKGMGENPEITNVPKLLNTYFKDVSALVGQELTVTIGYRGPHVERVDNNDFRVRDARGNPLLNDESFSDWSVAKLAAIESELKIKDFPEVVKIDAKAAKTEDDGDAW